MMRICLVTGLFAMILLSSCTTYQLGEHHDALCNELKSQIIFNGGTSYTRTSEIQSAEVPLVEQNYDRNC